ncbi:hypothetical protein VNO78_16601 [Psophocarpus tetragonolobus]|uniref:Uncharacterized protein n=1 Tax=Psophocarpus tetragonolobus TaxID=3891 RepID=A0AAN9SHD7_PSOTE
MLAASSISNLVRTIMLSTLEDVTIVKGLAGIPSEGPVLFVGNRMFLGLDKIPMWFSVPSCVLSAASGVKQIQSSEIRLKPPTHHDNSQGEEYKLFWPEQSEFVRMAARFGATIVPFGVVGEDDLGQVSSGLFSEPILFLYKS